MGGNAAEAHPCVFQWVTEASQQRRQADVVDPRFTRSPAWPTLSRSAQATDIASVGRDSLPAGPSNNIHQEYVKEAYTNASYIVNECFAFTRPVSLASTAASYMSTARPGPTSSMIRHETKVD